MKTTMKGFVLVVLMAVMCTSTCIAVMAAEDIAPANDLAGREEEIVHELFPDPIQEEAFVNDEAMVSYSRSFASVASDGTRLNGSRTADIENSPALRVDNKVTIPQVNLAADNDEEAPEEETTYSLPPNTGVESFASFFAVGFALMGCSALVLKKAKEQEDALNTK